MIARSDSLSSEFVFGLCLEVDSKGHVGILYHYDDKLHLLHLAWHHLLVNEVLNPYGKKYFTYNLNADESTCMLLAANASLFTNKKHAPIPYGIKLPLVAFDPNSNYEYIGGASGEGLTCATFVMKFLEAYGVKILDEATWKSRPEDEKWMSKIFDQLEGYLKYRGHSPLTSTDLRHVEDARKFISGAIRVRPIEVFASGTKYSSGKPVIFEEVDHIVKDIVSILKSA